MRSPLLAREARKYSAAIIHSPNSLWPSTPDAVVGVPVCHNRPQNRFSLSQLGLDSEAFKSRQALPCIRRKPNLYQSGSFSKPPCPPCVQHFFSPPGPQPQNQDTRTHPWTGMTTPVAGHRKNAPDAPPVVQCVCPVETQLRSPHAAVFAVREAPGAVRVRERAAVGAGPGSPGEVRFRRDTALDRGIRRLDGLPLRGPRPLRVLSADEAPARARPASHP